MWGNGHGQEGSRVLAWDDAWDRRIMSSIVGLHSASFSSFN